MIKYRSDIDGLRAIAVLPVIFFHVGFPFFSGGYVGVDVFFVISGYLITSIILQGLENDSFSLKGFYINRARRLLPALSFMLAITIPIAFTVMLPANLDAFFRSVIATLFFSSNLYFWRQTNYFSDAAELQPLIHTWSLGIEEQYYLLFPIFLIFLWKRKKILIPTAISLVFLLSFVFGTWGPELFNFSRATAYYLLPTRGWEILLGSISALFLYNKAFTESPLFYQWRSILSLIGFGMIFYAILMFSPSTPYPSAYTLMPTVGTFLIIVFNSKSSFLHKLLSINLLVYVGLLSYSAYLWHQPLIALSRHYLLDFPGITTNLLIVILTFVMAYISYKFVETPLRNKQKTSNTRFTRVIGFAITVIIIISISGISLKGFENYYLKYRTSPDSMQVLDYLNYKNTSIYKAEYSDGECFYDSTQFLFRDFNQEKCLRLSENNNILLVGDSFAAMYSGALKRKYPDTNLIQATPTHCKPFIGLKSGHKNCIDLYDYLYGEFLPINAPKIDGIIISARWDLEDLEPLHQTINFINELGIKIFLLGPTPEFSIDLPAIISKKIFENKKLDDVAFSSHQVLKVHNSMIDFVSNYEGELNFFSPYNVLCPDSSCNLILPSMIPIIFDYGHYTAEGASLVVDEMHKLTSYIESLKSR